MTLRLVWETSISVQIPLARQCWSRQVGVCRAETKEVVCQFPRPVGLLLPDGLLQRSRGAGQSRRGDSELCPMGFFGLGR
mmetsp:Transcript_27513/g.66326  ORF Transcript_27513/g.66326 Transcript_27513/m.66326 type:complete len:80 (+) Transcript_27513:863-1102(+)